MREIIKTCIENGFFLDKEVLNLFSHIKEDKVYEFLNILFSLKIKERVISKRLIINNFDRIKPAISLEDYPIYEIFFEGIGANKEVVEEKKEGVVKVLSAPAFTQRKVSVKDFIDNFRSRYNKIKTIFESRDFDNLTSIRKIGDDRGSYTIIVYVLGKRITKNKNLFIEVEDMSGTSIVLINQNKKELFEKARDLLEDDLVAFNVTGTSEMLFANDLFFPDASLTEKKYSDFDEYVAFTGDFHAGSKLFLEKNLLKFVNWLNGNEGDKKQREIAKKVKYLFVTGDVIDGISHYSGQEKFLTALTSVDQYKKVEDVLGKIRKDIQIIMCPGQHDSVWIGEPQPIIGERWAPGLHKMKNLYLVPNPCLVEIDGGFKILMYHGASINRFVDEIPDIRTNYGHRSPTRVVREMLKRRHLAPLHGSMDYIPCENGDPLVIETIPDIIATADQHRADVSIYNNILMISGSCWQATTPFEEKVGNVPDPCKVPLFNLKTREIKILDFSDNLKEIKWEEGDGLACKISDCPKEEECLKEVNCEEKKDGKV
ncbi:MAG: metallophosphoesterase [Candidatus Pacearchaeota archaeon]